MSSGVAKKQIQLFYDVLSPYSWIAFEALCRYRSKWNIELVFQPFLLGGIMKESGNKPPMFVGTKALYMQSDLQQLSQLYKIPMKMPDDIYKVIIEKGSMNAQRLLTAVKMEYPPESVEALSRQLWGRVWGRNEDICELTSLTEAMLRAGFGEQEASRMVGRLNEKDVRNNLKQTTQVAFNKYKAFGAPSIVVEGGQGREKLVFGSDRMEVIAQMLGEKYEGPLTSLAVCRV